MCILVHLTKNSQHICFASSNHNKVKEKKMFIRLHDNISPKCCNIVSLWAASCRKTLLLEFWRTLKKSRCDIHPACCLIKLASYSTNVQDFKVGFVFIYCLGKFSLNVFRIMHDVIIFLWLQTFICYWNKSKLW